MINIYEKNDYYTTYLQEKGVSLSNSYTPIRSHININFSDFQEIEKKYKPIIKHHIPRPYFEDGDPIKEIVMTYDLGYDHKNATEFNWGYSTEEENDDLVSALGRENLKDFGFNVDTVLARLMIYYPGNGIPLHKDTFHSFRSRYGKGKIKRTLVAVSPWDWGHFVQLHDFVWSNWVSGDTVEIPVELYHLSVNFGILPKYTVSITGFESD